ncbi:MAG: hypothetical protein JMM75_02775 [Candidatus Xiphinematobacter sp.]|nr:MAG: hypothetical protein JMM75_02775 [Candidatus Xiphinematobacter sp.]
MKAVVLPARLFSPQQEKMWRLWVAKIFWRGAVQGIIFRVEEALSLTEDPAAPHSLVDLTPPSTLSERPL